MATEVTLEELNVEELKVTSAVLMGAAHHYGNYCKDKNDAFMRCRYDKQDPRKCLEEGREVCPFISIIKIIIINMFCKEQQVFTIFTIVSSLSVYIVQLKYRKWTTKLSHRCSFWELNDCFLDNFWSHPLNICLYLPPTPPPPPPPRL